jgi:phage regulator Rha-like protein
MNIEIIHNKIYEIRGHRVMLDYEIAIMFEVETRTVNQAVKRNIERFPEDFMFQLTQHERDFQRSQIVIFEKSKGKYSKFLPYAFTEHGVTMLASVLRSEKAVKVSIAVVRAFISMKQYIADRKNISKQLATIKEKLKIIKFQNPTYLVFGI